MFDLSQEQMKRSMRETEHRLPDANATDASQLVVDDDRGDLVFGFAVGAVFGAWWTSRY